MNAQFRRGECPSLSEPMQTGDGLLVRVAPSPPDLTIEQMLSVADASSVFGNGVIEISGKGSLQLRGLSRETVPLLQTRFEGLRIKSGWPMTVGALAGIDHCEIRNPLPLAAKIEAASGKIAGRLAPKVSVAIDGGGQLPLVGIRADIRIQAQPQGWSLAIDRKDSADGILGSNLTEDQILNLCMNLLESLASKGPGARARDLVASDLTALGASMRISAATGSREKFPVGKFKIREGRMALGLAFAFGFASAEMVTDLIQKAADNGVDRVRFAPGRALILAALTARSAEALSDAANRLGFVTAPDDPRLLIAACAGKPACASGHIATRKLALRIAECAPALLDGSFRLHVSGCEKRCAEPPGRRLTVLGTADGCRTFLENGLDLEFAAAKSAEAISTWFSDCADSYKTGRKGGEMAANYLSRVAPASAVARSEKID